MLIKVCCPSVACEMETKPSLTQWQLNRRPSPSGPSLNFASRRSRLHTLQLWVTQILVLFVCWLKKRPPISNYIITNTSGWVFYTIAIANSHNYLAEVLESLHQRKELDQLFHFSSPHSIACTVDAKLLSLLDTHWFTHHQYHHPLITGYHHRIFLSALLALILINLGITKAPPTSSSSPSPHQTDFSYIPWYTLIMMAISVYILGHSL